MVTRAQRNGAPWKLIAFLIPFAYVARLLSTTIHEVCGHGLAALMVGGSFSGFTVRWDTSGLAQAFPPPASPLWKEVAVLAAGIVVVTLVGAAACFWVSRRRADSTCGMVLALFGLVAFTAGPSYALWGAFKQEGPTDPALMFDQLAAHGTPHLKALRIGWLIAAVGLLLLAHWWGLRLLWRHVETQLGLGRSMSRVGRFLAFGGLFVLPATIVFQSLPSASAPDLGRLPAYVSSGLFLLIAVVLARYPLTPFPRPIPLNRRHIIAAWCTLGVVALPIHLGLNDGVHWQSSDEARANAEVTEAYQGWTAWRDGRTEEALQTFERLRHPPWRGLLGTMYLIGALTEEGKLDAAVEVAESFAAESHDEDDTQTAWRFVARANERRGDWARALAAWEKQDPSTEHFDGGNAVNARLLGIARCRFKLGEVDAALGVLERCLQDGVPPSPADGGEAPDIDETASAYAEYAGRSDRLSRARSFIAELRGASRAKCEDALRIVEGWRTNHPDAVLRAAVNIRTNEHLELAARLLGEMGEPAIDVLRRGILAGDPQAIRIGGLSRSPEILPALEQRRLAGGADAEAAAQAIADYESRSSVTMSRPASRHVAGARK